MQPTYPPQAYPQQPYGSITPPQAYPPQPYAPAYPVQPQYPVAAYPQQPYAPPQPPAQPLPVGGLDEFYQQPSAGGGPSLKFMDAARRPQLGKTYIGTVERPVTNADIRAQTDNNGRPQTYRDGRPKFVMVVPLLVMNHPEFPEGRAGWWVKGQARDELARAMAEAGAPAGPPEAGATITVQLVGVRPVPNMNPAYQYRVHYVRPTGAPVASAQSAPMPQPAYAPAQVAQQPVPVAYAQPVPQPVYAPAQVAQQPMPQPVPVAYAQPMPSGLTEDQQALFARLTGQQTAA